MRVLADASLPGLKEAFPSPFELQVYHDPAELLNLLPQQDVLLVRSTLKVDAHLLKNHALKFVATASSGTDHLDIPWLKKQGIAILDAKGCNAKAVADYVLSCIAFLKKEKHLTGKKIGILGVGKVGSEVKRRLEALHFEVSAYDPLKPLPFQSVAKEALFHVDLLCIHAELHAEAPFPSLNLIDKEFLSQLKEGCIVLNAARGGLVDEEALLNSHHLHYCTDVFLNEPAVNARIIQKALLCTPHIAGHSIEAKFRAVSLVSEQLHLFANLPLPSFTSSTNHSLPQWDERLSWEKNILQFYNPLQETLLLKNALSKKEAFLSMRPKHTRHDFALSATNKLALGIQNLLGHSY